MAETAPVAVELPKEIPTEPIAETPAAAAAEPVVETLRETEFTCQQEAATPRPSVAVATVRPMTAADAAAAAPAEAQPEAQPPAAKAADRVKRVQTKEQKKAAAKRRARKEAKLRAAKLNASQEVELLKACRINYEKEADEVFDGVDTRPREWFYKRGLLERRGDSLTSIEHADILSTLEAKFPYEADEKRQQLLQQQLQQQQQKVCVNNVKKPVLPKQERVTIIISDD